MEYNDYLWRKEQEDKAKSLKNRRMSNRQLTSSILWLLDHDWSLLIHPRLWLVLTDFDTSYDTVGRCTKESVIRFDEISVKSSEDEELDCNITVWDYLKEKLASLTASNYNHLYLVKDNRMIIINCGSMEVIFVGSNCNHYKGFNIRVSETGIGVIGKPYLVENKTLRVKQGIRMISKDDLKKILLKSVVKRESF